MSKVTIFMSTRLVLALAVTVVMLLGLMSWTAVAYAQNRPNDVQYGSPTESGEAAIERSGNSATTGSAGGSGYEGSAGGSGYEGSAGGSGYRGSAGVAGVLPATGGPLLQLAALGTLALASTGLLVLRHHNRR